MHVNIIPKKNKEHFQTFTKNRYLLSFAPYLISWLSLSIASFASFFSVAAIIEMEFKKKRRKFV